ncbi:unnamed protein product [Prorocentrum cordatum]|uniref:Uncharacterized protein n=1 Tax=Prorocentrum cordatum TaxID=2364126 RepID=A0ABN9PU76_9DINO|nr:unnamed protein product [Polarella glacialis]
MEDVDKSIASEATASAVQDTTKASADVSNGCCAMLWRLPLDALKVLDSLPAATYGLDGLLKDSSGPREDVSAPVVLGQQGSMSAEEETGQGNVPADVEDENMPLSLQTLAHTGNDLA